MFRTPALIAAFALLATGCAGESNTASTDKAPEKAPAAEEPAKPAIDARHAQMFKPLPASAENDKNPSTDAKVALGKLLYFEKRLSKNQDLSCNSCHPLSKFGADGEPTSPGHKGQRGVRNSPTVYNAALHIAQFWDGREPDVEAQAKGPVLNPVEMAMPDAESVTRVLQSIPGYADLFKAAFPGDEAPVSFDNMALAIGAYERKLLTPGKWDKYLAGDASALTAEEIAGVDAFIDTGCTTCHMGNNLGGNMYMKLGLVKPYETADKGREDFTKKETDRHIFKVPSLRNVAMTAPYLHDGSIASLEEATKLMAEYQLGKELTDEQVAPIVTFMKALTGDVPGELVAEPTEFPESGPDTPKADPT